MGTLEKQSIEISGIVEKYLANKHGDIDALELKTEKEKLKIHFPPHTAKTVMHEAAEGSQVTVTYLTEEPEHDDKAAKRPKFKLAAVQGTGDMVDLKDTKPQKPASAPHTETIRVSQYELLKDKKGELTGIKAGNKLFHLHKEDAAFTAKLKPEGDLRITAVKRTDDGFVNKEHEEVYHIQNISIDGEEYHAKHKHSASEK